MVLFDLDISMTNNCLDRSNCVRGLLFLIGKDKKFNANSTMGYRAALE